MRDSVYRISLDIHHQSPQVQVTAKKGDYARSIHITFMEHGKPWLLPVTGDVRAVMTVITPDNVRLENDCEIYRDGTVVYDFTAMTVNKIGVYKCEITIYDADTGERITSARFTILVDDVVYESGRAGAGWRAAVDEVRDMVKQAVVTYTTAEQLQTAVLEEGDVVATTGRWEANDGGARTYVVMKDQGANSLAIKISDAGLYAVPVITDYVTAFDIGLKTGRMRSDQADGTSTGEAFIFTDDGIAATNSRLLQTFLDNLPQSIPPEDGIGTATDYWAQGAKMTRIFFPNGHWFFRDPLIVNSPVTIFGTAVQRAGRFSRDAAPFQPASRLLLCAREITVNDSGSSSLFPYAAETSGFTVGLQSPSDCGDNNQDLDATPKVQEKKYVETALFFVKATGVVFHDLEFSATTSTVYAPTGVPYDFRLDAISDPNWIARPTPGAAWNPFHVTRYLKGVNGIICCAPVTDANGRILVSANGKIKYSGPVWSTKIERCSFTGFSETALTTGRLTCVNDCWFRENYISIRVTGADNYFYNFYCDRGLVGIATDSHTIEMHDGWIDQMAGFGIVSGGMGPNAITKKTVVTGTYKSGGSTVSHKHCVYDGYVFGGELIGYYDCILDWCVMGAYLAGRISNGVKLTGKIAHCGTLYDSESTTVRQEIFGTQEVFDKTSYYCNNRVLLDANTGWKWDGSAFASDGVGETVAHFKGEHAADIGNYDFVWSAADIRLYALDTSFWPSVDPDEIVDHDGEEWIEKYNQILTSNYTPIGTDENGDPVYSDADKNAAETATTEYFVSAAESDNATAADYLSANRINNFNALLGAAGVNIALCYMLSADAEIGVRYNDTGRKDEQNNHYFAVTPLFAYNFIHAYDTNISDINPRCRSRESSVYGKYIMEPLAIHGYKTGLRVIIPQQTHKNKALAMKTYDSGDVLHQLHINMSHNNEGRPTFYVYGDFALTAGANVDTAEPTDLEPSPVNPNTAIADFELYPAYYTGDRQNVFAIPLYAGSSYPDTDPTVSPGDCVAMLLINKTDKRVRIHPLETYTGIIFPVRV